MSFPSKEWPGQDGVIFVSIDDNEVFALGMLMNKVLHQRHIAVGLIYWGKDGKGKVPAFKRYKHALKHGDGVVPNTWWTFDKVGHNDTAKKELMALLPEEARSFSTPKPSFLIECILQIACGPDDLVLDFFAGSGTTAHALLQQNAEDGGQRRFILVSSTEATADAPDKNLCRDVCARRVQRVIEGYGATRPASVAASPTCAPAGARRGGSWRSGTRRSGPRSR